MPNAAIELHSHWELTILAEGLASSALSLFETTRVGDQFETYLLPVDIAYPTTEAALACATEMQYEILLEKGYGPCRLYITFNERAVNFQDFWNLIEEICQRDGRLLLSEESALKLRENRDVEK